MDAKAVEDKGTQRIMAGAVMTPARRRDSHRSREKAGTHRIVNSWLLLISLVFALAAFVVGYLWYGYRTSRVAVLFKQRAGALEQEGNLREAAGYLKRYLQLEPNDLEARVQLVEVVEQFAKTTAQRRQLVGLLYETVGLLPGRNDFRLQLTNQLLEMGDFAGAEVEARKLLATADDDNQRAARRVIALSLRGRARPDGPVGIDQAAAALAAALADNPGDVTLASLTAELYREYPQRVDVSDAAKQADEFMDRLVNADPHNPEARVARYKYRRRYAPRENATQDLVSVLASNPDHVEALLLIANEESSIGDKRNHSAAEQKLLKVAELSPTDPRSYIGLARLYVVQGMRQRALDVLASGRAQLTAPSFELNGILCERLIDANRLDEAKAVLRETDQEFRRLLPELTSDFRMRLENFLRLLRARFSIARNDLGQATRELNAVVASAGQADLTTGATERIHAYTMLAGVMAKLGRWDLAAAHWKVVADQAPAFVEARRNAAMAYLELGRPAEAISQLETYLQSRSASPEAWIALVQAHMHQQTRLLPGQRNWSEFLTALEQAKSRLTHRWELTLVEVLYWKELGTDDDKRRALEQLKLLERAYVNNSALLERMVFVYQQLDSTTDAERILARYEEIENDKSRRAIVRSALLRTQGRVEEASKLLAAAATESSADQRDELQLARIKLLASARQMEAAQQVTAAMISSSPGERAPLMLGLEIAMMRRDFATAANWEDALKQLKAADDFDWRFYRARRFIGQFAKLDSKVRSELGSLIESLRSDRPGWFPVIALAAQYADLTGNRRQAIDQYRLSIELGERSPEIFERLITALYNEGQFSEANNYLARLGAAQPADGRIESLAIALAIQENRLDEALQTAKQAVDRGSNDPMHYVWLANLLSLNSQQQEAESIFRESIERFPNDNRVWNALFTYLVRTRQLDRAHRALEKWGEKVTVSEPQKHFILAQGYELLGDVTAAKDQYKAAIEKDSRNIDARMRLAKLLASRDVVESRRQFEEILKVDPENAEARRYLSALLAASGGEEDWTRAVRLLQASARAEEASADDRLRAILLARRGRNRAERLKNCEAARRILTTRLAQADCADLDRLLFAGILEQEATMRDDFSLMQTARDALRPLVDRENPSADHLAIYVQLLLRYLERWQNESDDPTRDQEIRVVLIDDARLRIDELQELLSEESNPESHFVPLAFRLRLLNTEGKREDSLRILKEFAQEQLQSAANEAERARLLLQLGNLAASVGLHQEAEEWNRQLLMIAPSSYVLLAKSLVDQNKLDDAVEVCLQAAPNRPSAEVATVLAQLLSRASGSSDVVRRVEPLITSALDAEGDNVELLMSVAVQHVMEDNSDEAIKLFKRVVDLQPNHALALNNLATLLADRPNQLSEARRYVEQAMAVTGRSPALLDTLGTILIRAGQHNQAVVALEEAVAGIAHDPRYYFHLAVAYQRSGRVAEARDALDTARKYGLDRAILTGGDRELLASLNQELLTAVQHK